MDNVFAFTGFPEGPQSQIKIQNNSNVPKVIIFPWRQSWSMADQSLKRVPRHYFVPYHIWWCYFERKVEKVGLSAPFRPLTLDYILLYMLHCLIWIKAINIFSKPANKQIIMWVFLVVLLFTSVAGQNCTTTNCLLCADGPCTQCSDAFYLSNSTCVGCTDSNCKVCPLDSCSACLSDYYL